MQLYAEKDRNGVPVIKKKNRNGVPVRSDSKRTLDVSGASINYCVSSTCFKSASGSSVVFAVRTFSISPLTYLRKISLRTTANIGETENQRVSVERLQRYGDLTIFKMAAIRHLGFSKLKFLKVRKVTRPIFLHCRTNFVKIRQTVAEISRFL